jgi:acetolactate synthase-1/2/3 large subunit
MKVADFLVECLIKNGVTDVVGLPGEVVLEFLDALDRRSGDIHAHICYHEQAGALAACGYAQASGKLGVAYATKGPGIMNMMSAIQDAYCDSIPVAFITAHESAAYNGGMRFKDNQELDTAGLFSPMTKRVVRINNLDTAVNDIETVISLAQSDRPGPVLLDFSSKLLSAEVPTLNSKVKYNHSNQEVSNCHAIAEHILMELRSAKRPVILFGAGILQSKTQEFARSFLEYLHVPALTSRFSQDIVGGSELNFGYVGSHATRYSNTILMKCDLIVSLGNRMALNPDSATFGEVVKNTRIIRVDVDENEFARVFPNTEQYKVNLSDLMPLLTKLAKPEEKHQKWLSVCRSIREILIDYDTDDPVRALSIIIQNAEAETIFTSDVGNNEFWLSRAYTHANVSNRILYSKSFGLLGCSLPKAIGAQIASGSKVICFTGDQGFQMNIQELQFITTNKLQILIVVVNNNSSGMILSRQRRRNSTHFLHTSADGGYFPPPLSGVANAYGIGYHKENCENIEEIGEIVSSLSLPCILELTVPETADISPHIPFGNRSDEFVPPTRDEDKKHIEELLF